MLSSRVMTGGGADQRTGIKQGRKKPSPTSAWSVNPVNICTVSRVIVLAYTPVFP